VTQRLRVSHFPPGPLPAFKRGLGPAAERTVFCPSSVTLVLPPASSDGSIPVFSPCDPSGCTAFGWCYLTSACPWAPSLESDFDGYRFPRRLSLVFPLPQHSRASRPVLTSVTALLRSTTLTLCSTRLPVPLPSARIASAHMGLVIRPHEAVFLKVSSAFSCENFFLTRIQPDRLSPTRRFRTSSL